MMSKKKKKKKERKKKFFFKQVHIAIYLNTKNQKKNNDAFNDKYIHGMQM